ncbi:hypothetical protein J7E61_06490 [Pseudomonas fluorescens]|uniref:Uncharacterized protein n=1 Tax=Pseudomonas fluorescens TaxID=294 RepID=A0A944DJ33_PSEFL|nr:hypothetical protein [Pseudomonas fluorescens]MBT2311823.1 hypothetical protein [Pseudomonas fluorescens]MBT2316774.1 hypothetical protein [Pseudomonas fluorescens]MBT2329797.1 hypothetical protein [Pseudomonas fluorescens]MBT2344593.1 hypothetical protein [Pseudomonas fluorescens]MBT2348017.1 hypothetical protein [Pseudomonas fluorescens]
MAALFFFLSMLLAALASPDVRVDQGKQVELVVQEKAGAQVALAVLA